MARFHADDASAGEATLKPSRVHLFSVPRLTMCYARCFYVACWRLLAVADNLFPALLHVCLLQGLLYRVVAPSYSTFTLTTKVPPCLHCHTYTIDLSIQSQAKSITNEQVDSVLSLAIQYASLTRSPAILMTTRPCPLQARPLTLVVAERTASLRPASHNDQPRGQRIYASTQS